MKIAATLIGFLACAVSSAQEFSLAAPAQEFTLATLKGDVIVKVTQNIFSSVETFHLAGVIRNTTAFDLKDLRMRVAFYDYSGNEMDELCRPANIYCNTEGKFDIQAGATKPWNDIAAPRGPLPNNIKSFKLFFKEAKYHVKWAFALVKPSPSDTLSFEDESVSVTFLIAPDGIGCALRNKTADPVTINWDRLSWVDYLGEAHRLIHSGIKLADKEASQPPTVIPPLARISETLFAADHVKASSSRWTQEPIWPDLLEMDGEDHSHLKRFEGAMFSVFLPLEIEGRTRNYNFIFTTASIEF